MKAYAAAHTHYFRWQGQDQQRRFCSGTMTANHEMEARQQLHQRHIHVIKLRPCAPPLRVRMQPPIRPHDITLFTRQLYTMLNSGVPILEALTMVCDHQKQPAMQALLRRMLILLESGTALSETLRTMPQQFDQIYIELIASGEQSGQLTAIFERLVTYRENRENLRAKMRKALIYPTIVIASALLVSYLMLTLVIPEFDTMFRGFGAQLPWFTRQVIALSATMRQTGWLILTLVILLLLGGNIWRRRSPMLRRRSHQWALTFPLFGSLLRKASLARFSRTVATSFSAGIPILLSLQSGARTCGNLYYQHLAEQLCQELATGSPLHHALRQNKAFPELMVQMVMIGEQSGRLDDMLNKIADLYEQEVEDRVDNLGKLIEPLLILLLGGLVGALVIAMYLPIFNLMSVLG